jgi:hypothetical protein
VVPPYQAARERQGPCATPKRIRVSIGITGSANPTTRARGLASATTEERTRTPVARGARKGGRERQEGVVVREEVKDAPGSAEGSMLRAAFPRTGPAGGGLCDECDEAAYSPEASPGGGSGGGGGGNSLPAGPSATGSSRGVGADPRTRQAVGWAQRRQSGSPGSNLGGDSGGSISALSGSSSTSNTISSTTTISTSTSTIISTTALAGAWATSLSSSTVASSNAPGAALLSQPSPAAQRTPVQLQDEEFQRSRAPERQSDRLFEMLFPAPEKAPSLDVVPAHPEPREPLIKRRSEAAVASLWATLAAPLPSKAASGAHNLQQPAQWREEEEDEEDGHAWFRHSKLRESDKDQARSRRARRSLPFD